MSTNCKPNYQLNLRSNVKHRDSKSEEPPRHLDYKLVSCKFCNRAFFANRIQYHEKVCQSKFSQLKRPVYDATKFRLTGTGAERFQEGNMMEGVKRPLNTQWREIREKFQSTVKLRKIENKSTVSAAASEESKSIRCAVLASYVQCPICGRRFNEKAAFHHIPNCTNYVMIMRNKAYVKSQPRAGSLSLCRSKK